MRALYNSNQNTAQQPKLTALPYPCGHITPRETQILVLMAQGCSNKEIARRLNISPETVNTHQKNIYQKTGAQNKIEAIIKTRWLTATLPATETNC